MSQPAAPPPPPQDVPVADQAADNDDESSSDDESVDGTTLFESDDKAVQVRQAALALFNQGQLDAALALQVRVVRYFTAKYGEDDARCGVHYLDYGITLLTIIQSSNAEVAALSGNIGEPNEDIEVCLHNLEAAKVCLERAEDEAKTDEERKKVYLRLAEVHESLAELHNERDDDEEVLKEYEYALVLKRTAEDTTRSIVATMFQIGMVYLRNEDFDKAKECLGEAVELGKTSADVPQDLREEMQTYLDEATEMQAKPQQMDKVREEIRKLFPDEDSQIVQESQQERSSVTASASNSFVPPASNGGLSLVAQVPGELAASRGAGASSNGGGRLLSNNVVPSREASQSCSVFPRQFARGSGAQSMEASLARQDVNTAVPVRKKPRAPKAAGNDDAAEAPVAADEKRHRTEE